MKRANKCKDCFGAANNDCEQCEEIKKMKNRKETKLYEVFMNCCQKQAILWLETTDGVDVMINCKEPENISVNKMNLLEISGTGTAIWNLLRNMDIKVDW